MNRTSLLIENTCRDTDFWLPVYDPRSATNRRVFGHLKFRKTGEHLFQLCDMRPANAPLLGEEDPENLPHEARAALQLQASDETPPGSGRGLENIVVTAEELRKFLGLKAFAHAPGM
ncbi:MAG: hypothetical protein H7829_03455 [Magnetococcus sp. THC-1_WYH]